MRIKKVRPEDIDPEEYRTLLQEMSDDPIIQSLVDDADEGAKKAIRDSLDKCKSIGVEITEKNFIGFLYHFSYVQSELFYNTHKNWGEECFVNALTQMMMRYYKSMYELIQAEDALKG